MTYPPPAPTSPFNGTEACTGASKELFFSRDPRETAVARAICAGCPMRATCDEWALQFEEFGFWAGRTVAERKRVRKERGMKLRRPEARGPRTAGTNVALAA